LKRNVIAWRRDIHEHPELGNNEYRTAKLIADHLRSLGIEVKEGVGKTGVVGVLKGAKPGPCIALRADMDGLPIVERVDLPFASKVKSTYNGKEVGVMHACGHGYTCCYVNECGRNTSWHEGRFKRDSEIYLSTRGRRAAGKRGRWRHTYDKRRRNGKS
jgi:amidohydrolase